VEDPCTLEQLSQRANVPVAALSHARERLLARALIEPCGDGEFRLTDAGHETLELLTATGQQRLSDLLREWRPEQNPELASLIAVLARDFFIDSSALDLRAASPTPALAGS